MWQFLFQKSVVVWLQSYKKSYEKAPDMTEKRSPMAQVLTQVKSFSIFGFERYSFADLADSLGGDIEERSDPSLVVVWL